MRAAVNEWWPTDPVFLKPDPGKWQNMIQVQ